MPTLGAVWATLALLGTSQNPLFVARITDPALGLPFVLAVVQLAGMLVAVAAGAAATVRNYRRSGRTSVALPSALLLAVAALTVGCGGAAPVDRTGATPAASAAGAQQLVVVANSGVRFEPSTMVVRAGQPVELTLRNDSELPHDFVLSEGVRQPIKVAAARGQSAVGTFTFDRPGTFTFVCSEPGHEFAGMKGAITAR
jgi:uncharacterized cupredoxin-like copper-binding protein